MINFIKYRKIYYFISGTLIAISIGCLFIFGLKFGIDFTGGSILELDFERKPEVPEIQEKLSNFNLGEIVVQPTSEKGVIIRMREVDEDTHQQILLKLEEISKFDKKRFESIGPVIGNELRRKTAILIIVSLSALFFYIGIAFRKISRVISPWQYGIISIFAISFDVLIAVGVFSILGKMYNVQFNIPIVTALLTILGYTINDKVVIFDRVRENVFKIKEGSFEEIINQSLNQILVRSVSTGFCTLLVLISILLFGGETLKYFAFTLIIGIIVGTYSSIFLAPFILIDWLKRGKKP